MKNIHEQIAELQKQASEIDRVNRTKQTEAWNELRSKEENWEWRVIPRGEICRVEKRINPIILEAWKSGGLPSLSSHWQDGQWHGMNYFRTEEKILTHNSGGVCVLKDPMLCNDSEWQELTEGKIQAKYKR